MSIWLSSAIPSMLLIQLIQSQVPPPTQRPPVQITSSHRGKVQEILQEQSDIKFLSTGESGHKEKYAGIVWDVIEKLITHENEFDYEISGIKPWWTSIDQLQ